jgi:hypothetical protein
MRTALGAVQLGREADGDGQRPHGVVETIDGDGACVRVNAHAQSTRGDRHARDLACRPAPGQGHTRYVLCSAG